MKMNIKTSILFFLLLLFVTVYFPRPANAVSWKTDVDLFQITTDGLQQSGAAIYQDTVMWTDWRGSIDTSLDIYGYNLKKKQEFPVIVKEGQQRLAGFDNRYVVYNQYFDASDPNAYDVRVYDLKKSEDTAITDEVGSQSAEDYHNRTIVYLEGGACGTLYAYNIVKHEKTHITDEACAPVRIYNSIVIWGYAAPQGSNIYGYDLRRKRQFDIATADGFQESPDIYQYSVVWLHREGDYYAIYLKNLLTGKIKLLHETDEYYINYPAVSRDYVVWGKSHQQHFAGVEGIDLRTGELFEIQEEGSHQNTNLSPAIWDDTAVWTAWRTGNGDIYGAELDRRIERPSFPTLPDFPPMPPLPSMP